MIKYANIVFLQGEDDFNSFRGGSQGFFNANTKRQFKYLKQWDFGEYWNLSTKSSAGTSDRICRDYYPFILIINSQWGYAGLERVIEVNEDDEIINTETF